MRKTAALFFILVIVLASCSKKAVKPEAELTPEEKFQKANTLIDKKSYDEARKLLEEVKAEDSGRHYAPLAQLRIADSYTKEGEPELAVAEYKVFLDSYPTNKYASYAQYQIAMTYYHQINGPDRSLDMARKALEAFGRLERLYPRNPYRDTVAFNIERTREILAEHEFMVGDFYFKKEAYKGALTRFLGLLTKYPDYDKLPDVLYRIAVSYEELGDKTMAAQYLQRLREKYPGSEALKEAEEAIGRGS
jgi:outer membrane protein assembly factor BamD